MRVSLPTTLITSSRSAPVRSQRAETALAAEILKNQLHGSCLQQIERNGWGLQKKIYRKKCVALSWHFVQAWKVLHSTGCYAQCSRELPDVCLHHTQTHMHKHTVERDTHAHTWLHPSAYRQNDQADRKADTHYTHTTMFMRKHYTGRTPGRKGVRTMQGKGMITHGSSGSGAA